VKIALILMTNLLVIIVIETVNCIILNSKLQKVKEEVRILSYKEIIKMLQVELDNNMRLKNRSELENVIERKVNWM
jgi:hypothetical protein